MFCPATTDDPNVSVLLPVPPAVNCNSAGAEATRFKYKPDQLTIKEFRSGFCDNVNVVPVPPLGVSVTNVPILATDDGGIGIVCGGTSSSAAWIAVISELASTESALHTWLTWIPVLPTQTPLLLNGLPCVGVDLGARSSNQIKVLALCSKFSTAYDKASPDVRAMPRLSS